MRPGVSTALEWVGAWLPPVLYSGLIFYLSSLSVLPAVLPEIPGLDKVQHAMEYAILSGLMTRAVERGGHGAAGASVFAISIWWCAVYALSDEMHQAFVAGRSADAWDWVADVAGAAVIQWPFIRAALRSGS